MLLSMTTNHGLRIPPVLPSAMATTTASPDPLVLPSCLSPVWRISAATMPRALVSLGSTTASHPLTLGTTCSTRMSSLPTFSTPGSLPHKGVSSQSMIAPPSAPPPHGMLLQLSSTVQ